MNENIVMKSETLSLMGYPAELMKIFIEFYQQFFENDVELENFFENVFKFDQTNKTPRRILNQIQQLISIADDIDKIRPGRDPLRIFFMRSCLEAIYKLAGKTNKQAGIFFEEYLCEQGKEYILSSFKLLDMEPQVELTDEKIIQFERKRVFNFELKHFAELFRSVRNNVAHEGNYYEMQFWARDNEYTWLSSCESDECVLDSALWKKKEFGVVSFHFETTMMYEKFRYYFVKGCIKFLNDYIHSLDN